MKLPEPMSWNRAEARKGKFDGKFIIGVMTTGIYCLPSCAARPPKPQNVRLFTTEAEAKAAGLRACKRCRPDLYYKGEDENMALFEGLAARVAADPDEFADASALAKAAGVSLTKLADLYRDHAHLAPAPWLRRVAGEAARPQELLGGTDRVAEIGFGAGFESESVFHRQFLNQMRMTPGAYRALDGAQVFMLQLPRLAIGPRKSLAITPAIRERSAKKAKAIASGKPCRPRTARRWWKSASSRARPG